jgi:pimeloyl-ACP methyl ester carboxylesterase
MTDASDPSVADDSIRPFTIDIADDVLDDLEERLRRTRWPEAEVVDDWSQGVPLSYVADVCRYWAEEYDWRHRERLLNRFDQFVTTIDGLDVHFIHVRSPRPDAVPLLLSHGWPGSIVEFAKVIGPLTDPEPLADGSAAPAFHVVAPSLPGFGFSGKPTEPGWGVDRMATTFAALMARLGYDRYVAQGGDWGAGITTSLGVLDPDHCDAIHVTLTIGVRPQVEGEPTPEEARALERLTYYQEWDSGYSTQQKTRPQTVGYGLVDSPAGQAAWILEKFWAWTDCDGHPENVLGRDELLDNIMLYWVNATGASSARIYWESFGRMRPRKVTVPSGVTVYPREIFPPVRTWTETFYTNLQYWNEQPSGGHFAAMEVPELFVADLRDAFTRMLNLA